MAGPGPPSVRAKDLQAIKALRVKEQWLRLDTIVFGLLYSADVALAVKFAASYQWFKLQLTCYALGAIGLLNILAWLSTHWSVKVKAFMSCLTVRDLDDADMVLVVPAKFSGSMELVPLERRTLREGLHETVETTFEFRKQRFVLNHETNTFEKQKFPTKETFGTYSVWSGHGTLHKASAAFDKYGSNQFDVPVPAFSSLLKEQLMAPFFCFQVFCVALWTLDDYWYYSLFTLFMLVTFECTVVHARLRNLRELRQLAPNRQNIQVYRCGKWEPMPGEALLPGDLVSIGRPSGSAPGEEKVVPADCLLLVGSCIVEEAVLTGESTPQWKVSISDADPAEHLNIKQHKGHMLFGGTKILQHTGDRSARIRTPDGGCMAVVLRTGFETAQGRLMRTILYSTERVTANSLEAGIFILFLLVFAVAASWHVLAHGLADPSRDRFKLILNCVMILTCVIPPELPMELSMAVNASLVALARKRIYCTEPFRIPFAGKVDVCCFDKTGTLTSDHLLLEAVVGGDDQRTPLVMAACQSLVTVEGELVGDPLEKVAFESTRWALAGDTVVSPDKRARATAMHRFHFSSNLKRMSVVLRVEDEQSSEGRYEVVCKGAPEVVKGFLEKVPEGYDSLYKSYTFQGARVISLATRRLPSSLDAAALRAMTRDEVEARLQWAGFAVFQCPVKEDSEPVLRQLKESSHQLMMITGDAPLTACHAARGMHVVSREVLVLSHVREERGHVHGIHSVGPVQNVDDEYQWVSPDEATVLPFSRDWPEVLLVASQYDLCMTGDALAYIESIGLGPKLIPLCQVFARVSPEQKELVVVTLRSAGRTTLMCGDGTNDVGALKASHVGVALLAGPPDKAKQKKEDKDGGPTKDRARSSPASHKLSEDPASTSGRGAQGAVVAAKGQAKKGAGEKYLETMRAAGRPVTPQMEKWAKVLDEMDTGDQPMLKPGDASMASPFTAKSQGVTPVCDIVRQGRSTLVTTVLMFKILGLQCLSTAFTLSVMYMQGVKLSDIQATLTGMLATAMFFFISQAKPLNTLSPVRPHPTIFTFYFFASMIIQFSVQLGLLLYMWNGALAAMPEEERQSYDAEFKPNLVNSVCYVVQAVVQLQTFVVNYVGHPFNIAISENKGMATSLKWMVVFLFVLVFEIVPSLNSWFRLVPIPAHLRVQLVLLGVGSCGFNFFVEHTLRTVFAAPRPPEKGYMVYEKELKALTAARKKQS